MDDMNRTQPERERLDQGDIRSGMSLMQTVYTVAMVLGLEKLVEASYGLLFSPSPAGPELLQKLALSLVLVAIVLLAIRFFWVPRNLNSYILNFFDALGERVFVRMTTIHFPIALGHALLFYFVCQVFVDMATAFTLEGPAGISAYAPRFVLLYTALLLLNAFWLFAITPRGAWPGNIWAYNNFIHAGLALAALGAMESLAAPRPLLVVLASAIFISNSVVDLWRASKFYILYEDDASAAAEAGQVGRWRLRRRPKLLAVAAGAAFLLGAALLLIAWQRWQLPYNELGRYFDPSSSVVYRVEARSAYTLLGCLAWVASAGLFVTAFLLRQRRKRAS